MFSRILSLLIACALVVPGVAWGAHLSGHGQLATPEATHTHHYDDDHEGALQVTVSDEQGSDDSGPIKGLTHDHGPSHSHASAFVAPDGSLVISSLVADQLLFDRYASVHAPARVDTLLRPPRIS